jgi:acetyltransferase-like isoleucine patch superfamily enzyme
MKLLKKIIKNCYSRLPLPFQCKIHSFFYSEKIKIGEGSYIHPSVHLLGSAGIKVGKNSCVSEGSWLNVNRIYADSPSIEILDNCFIGKNNFFSSGKKIIMGSYTLTTNRCQFIGSSHIINDPSIPYLSTGTSNEDEIIVGSNCFFGASSTVLGNVSIGHGSVIGANAVIQNCIPPFSIVVGNPAMVIKRFSFSKKMWVNINEFTHDDEELLPNEVAYLRQLEKQFPRIAIPWIAAGRSLGNL